MEISILRALNNYQIKDSGLKHGKKTSSILSS